MDDSFICSSESDCDTSTQPKQKKRRLLLNSNGDQPPLNQHQQDHRQNAPCPATKRWRTEAEQQIYSSKLFQAIRHVRRSSARGKEIRQTADRVLAVTAKGTTRWSRAILATPLSLKLKKRHVKVKTGYSRLRKKAEAEAKAKAEKRRNLPPVVRKLRVLSRLIPGCRKVSCLNLLEEATDYIAALEMQVRAMTALTEILAGENRLGSSFSS